MITTDTIAPAAEAVTEPDEEQLARYRRERHAELMDALEHLTDMVADAGPDAGLGGDVLRVELDVSLYDGSITERSARLHAIAAALDVEIEEHPHGDTVQFWARRRREGVDYHATVIAKGDAEIAEARAALAETAPERVTVDYRVEHDWSVTGRAVTAALARHGVDVYTGPAEADHGHPTVTPLDAQRDTDRVFVDCGDYGAGLPVVEQCVSVDAYAATIAAYVRGDYDTPCPARPAIAFRAIRADGAVLTAYACEPYHDDADGDLIDEGYTVVRLASPDILTGTTCGHRVAMGGAR